MGGRDGTSGLSNVYLGQRNLAMGRRRRHGECCLVLPPHGDLAVNVAAEIAVSRRRGAFLRHDRGCNGEKSQCDDKAGGSHYNHRPVEPTILRNFVVLEGLDGSGTSTQLKMLSRRLTAEGRRHAATWEPTDGPFGSLLRSILAREVEALPTTIAMLYAADRNQHVNEPETGILALARKGVLVVSDRYVFSSLAYQSIECGFDYVLGLNAGFPLPELLFFLDTPVEVSQARLAGRDRVELFDGVDFQSRVRDGYLESIERFRSSGMRICIINGDRTADSISDEIWTITGALPITRM